MGLVAGSFPLLELGREGQASKAAPVSTSSQCGDEPPRAKFPAGPGVATIAISHLPASQTQTRSHQAALRCGLFDVADHLGDLSATHFFSLALEIGEGGS